MKSILRWVFKRKDPNQGNLSSLALESFYDQPPQQEVHNGTSTANHGQIPGQRDSSDGPRKSFENVPPQQDKNDVSTANSEQLESSGNLPSPANTAKGVFFEVSWTDTPGHSKHVDYKVLKINNIEVRIKANNPHELNFKDVKSGPGWLGAFVVTNTDLVAYF